jgi:chromate transport protein ChrA
MRRHSGRGLGGILGLVIALLVGLVPPFFLSHEVGQLYERSGRQAPVTALTGLWYFPGMLILVGPFIWFVTTNRRLNEYWEGLGVRQTTLV